MTTTTGEPENPVTSLFTAVGLEPRVGIYGCGGAGNNIVSALRDYNLGNVETVAINTDASHLARAEADTKILLGEGVTNGCGAGGRPDVGEAAARAARAAIQEAVTSDLAFIVTGLGGGTGTGASPVLAETARDMGAVIITIAIMPFKKEGRHDVARKGLKRLRETSEAVLVIKNDLVLDMMGEIPMMESFAAVNAAVALIVKSTTERLSGGLGGIIEEEMGEVVVEGAASVEAGAGPMAVVPQAVVQASSEIAPLTFDEGGTIGWG